MNADEQGHLTGTANVKWFLVTGRVEDCASAITLVNETQADLTGQMGPGDQVTVNVFYQPAKINLADTCTNPEGSISGDRTALVTPENLQLTVPASGATVTIDQVLNGPEQTPGSAVIVVHPVTP
jgi:hypothetical protein